MKKTILITVAAMMLTGMGAYADDVKARAIMEKVDARDDGKTIEQDMLMVLIDKNGKKRTQRQLCGGAFYQLYEKWQKEVPRCQKTPSTKRYLGT